MFENLQNTAAQEDSQKKRSGKVTAIAAAAMMSMGSAGAQASEGQLSAQEIQNRSESISQVSLGDRNGEDAEVAGWEASGAIPALREAAPSESEGSEGISEGLESSRLTFAQTASEAREIVRKISSEEPADGENRQALRGMADSLGDSYQSYRNKLEKAIDLSPKIAQAVGEQFGDSIDGAYYKGAITEAIADLDWIGGPNGMRLLNLLNEGSKMMNAVHAAEVAAEVAAEDTRSDEALVAEQDTVDTLSEVESEASPEKSPVESLMESMDDITDSLGNLASKYGEYFKTAMILQNQLQMGEFQVPPNDREHVREELVTAAQQVINDIDGIGNLNIKSRFVGLARRVMEMQIAADEINNDELLANGTEYIEFSSALLNVREFVASAQQGVEKVRTAAIKVQFEDTTAALK